MNYAYRLVDYFLHAHLCKTHSIHTVSLSFIYFRSSPETLLMFGSFFLSLSLFFHRLYIQIKVFIYSFTREQLNELLDSFFFLSISRSLFYFVFFPLYHDELFHDDKKPLLYSFSCCSSNGVERNTCHLIVFSDK